MTKHDVKRRLFFSDIYDYNYLTYHLFIILHELHCVSEDRAFKDHRSMPVLFELMNNRECATSFVRHAATDTWYTDSEYIEMLDLYVRSRSASKQFVQLAMVLSRRGQVGVKVTKGVVSLWATDEAQLQAFFQTDLFAGEIALFRKLVAALGRVRIVRYETIVEKVFESKGVVLWQT